MFSNLGKLLVITGIILIVIGGIFYFSDRFPFSKIPLGRLPGDIIIKKENFSFYFPIVTCLVLSGILSLIFWLLTRR